ncbi:hypothetical protein FB45DRAFT_862926 [Roridomyces roridus]|uniref:Uncharacterized protein n=1 Tax=Roridomyces roridus TaxID=1738132 RepID=A0AAD7FX03_9AGAR|nr:hypothetical protein FB45DRAFT_862926 [Roridomyces roridus]
MISESQNKCVTSTTVTFVLSPLVGILHVDLSLVTQYPVPAVLYFAFLYISAKLAELLLSKIARERYTECILDDDRIRPAAHRESNNGGEVYGGTVRSCGGGGAHYLWAIHLRNDLPPEHADVAVNSSFLRVLQFRPSTHTSATSLDQQTLFAIILVACVLQQTLHPALATLALLWLFHASTEQPLFVGLIIYRLQCCSKRTTQCVLYFSAVQSLIIKFGVSIYLFIWWGLKLSHNNEQQLDVAFSVLFVLALSALMGTQGYGSWAAWRIAQRMDRKGKGDAGGWESTNHDSAISTAFQFASNPVEILACSWSVYEVSIRHLIDRLVSSLGLQL